MEWLWIIPVLLLLVFVHELGHFVTAKLAGITVRDSHTVDIWTAYMLWLKRPMIFNGSEWGLGDVALAETTLQCVADRT